MPETALEIRYARWVGLDQKFREARVRKELADATESFKNIRPEVDRRYAEARAEATEAFATLVTETISAVVKRQSADATPTL
jgi:hypothetical protein